MDPFHSLNHLSVLSSLYLWLIPSSHACRIKFQNCFDFYASRPLTDQTDVCVCLFCWSGFVYRERRKVFSSVRQFLWKVPPQTIVNFTISTMLFLFFHDTSLLELFSFYFPFSSSILGLVSTNYVPTLWYLPNLWLLNHRLIGIKAAVWRNCSLNFRFLHFPWM